MKVERLKDKGQSDKLKIMLVDWKALKEAKLKCVDCVWRELSRY